MSKSEKSFEEIHVSNIKDLIDHRSEIVHSANFDICVKAIALRTAKNIYEGKYNNGI